MKKIGNLFNKNTPEGEEQEYQDFQSMSMTSIGSQVGPVSSKEMEARAKEIFEWAKKKGANYYAFIAYPLTGGILEKQETFLDLNYSYDRTLLTQGKVAFSFQQLEKGEGDGSSFPSGGLRVTHKARAYTVWDTKSNVYVRQRNNVLYIPSMLVTHDGDALDDKTLFRKAERVLQNKTLELLGKMKINAAGVVMALGLEQQFFVVTKAAVDKRLDIRSTGRAMVGKMPPKHQQFSDQYYGKIPSKVEDVLKEVEKELFEIGIPCKTRHKQVAPNQFQFIPLFEDAGKTIDHNMILMEILKEKFEERGLSVLLHEKPFANINGSGKHCNWSLNYIDGSGNLKNLFSVPKKKEDEKIFQLFILIQLKALINHSKLYLSSVAACGNQLRLGGHEAPPRIISAFLGEAVSKIVDGESLAQRKNLKEDLPNLAFDLLQEDTDRNRTSPYAYTGNKFEFRAVGSSQNVSFPMAVIAATIAREIEEVLKEMESGVSADEIITRLREETKAIRYDDNGYSAEWVAEAKARGLYVNEKFYENIENFKEAGKVFVDIGACKQTEIMAKYEVMKDLYKNTVNTEMKALLSMMSNTIIPEGYKYLNSVSIQSSSKVINARSEKFIAAFEEMLSKEEELKEMGQKSELSEVSDLRSKVHDTCLCVNKVLEMLPKCEAWAEFEDFMLQY